jgi:RNA polymerase sigma-70 factor, ECF subfamily
VRNIAAGALRRVENPTAWLYRSARNAVIDHYRTRHVHEPLDQAAELWPEPAPVEDRPNEATQDLAHCLRPLAAQLPDIYREALERVDLAGQSHHAAATELGISTSGMKSRVQRARSQLKELLTACCAVQVDRLGAVTAYHPNTGTCGCRDSA